MNIDDPRHPWRRLAAAARRATPPPDDDAPFGFAARVAARAMSGEYGSVSPYERFALRAVALAGLLALASVMLNFTAVQAQPAPDLVVEVYDPVALLLGD